MIYIYICVYIIWYHGTYLWEWAIHGWYTHFMDYFGHLIYDTGKFGLINIPANRRQVPREKVLRRFFPLNNRHPS